MKLSTGELIGVAFVTLLAFDVLLTFWLHVRQTMFQQKIHRKLTKFHDLLTQEEKK